ncbi:hypothetical protein THAOC_32979 [Thalassiosira oceanica]|uniref:Uncharacterized protein n=1 Tax=Thalassiosira oceanica TaxID=159749 RepID=K0RNB6_THAOC|nr:hypothetical protein THAOC_32979 [Thalassiosira oceanica]|eukprot:EJK48242.1 hypothetical protein THAOC_32979 [Thalassiosira oceanica]
MTHLPELTTKVGAEIKKERGAQLDGPDWAQTEGLVRRQSLTLTWTAADHLPWTAAQLAAGQASSAPHESIKALTLDPRG